MSEIHQEGFRLKMNPAGEKTCKIEFSPKLEQGYCNEVLPVLDEGPGRVNSNWELSSSGKGFSLSLNGRKVAAFSGPRKDPPANENEEEKVERWLSFGQKVGEDTMVFGLGEKTRYLEKSGAVYEMWNRDAGGFYTHNEDPLYSTIPFYLLKNPENSASDFPFVGVYLHNSERSRFAVKTGGYHDRVEISVKAPVANFYLFPGSEVKEIIENYTELTGKPFLPPRWALGYHHSEYGKPADQEEALELAKQFRDKNIPCDAIYFDIQHMKGNSDFTWDREAFPDPKELIGRLHQLGFHVVNIVDPGIKEESGYDVYESGLEKDAYVRDGEGDYFIGSVWPGFCVFPDFVRKEVREWWADQNENLLDGGVDGIWNDMNEPAVFFGKKQLRDLISKLDERINRQDLMDYETKSEFLDISEDNTERMVHRTDDGKDVAHEKVHNLYALYEARATEKAFRKEDSEKRSFILTRAGFPGIQKHAAKWTGDNSSTWEHMKMSISMSLNLGLSGVSFVGSDVGGFHGDVESELLTRWIQLGSVMPFYRNHSGLGTTAQEPWSF